MHWFFALTEDSTAFREYADMIMVAVHTARKFTSLVSHCLYDGGDSDFTQWLTQHDVRIIRHRSFLHDDLAELGRRKNNPHFCGCTFRRVLARGAAGPHGLVGRRYPRSLYRLRCHLSRRGRPRARGEPLRVFRCRTRRQQDDYVNMNTGVMLMNTERLRESLSEFREYIRQNLASSSVNRGTKQPSAGSIEIVMGRSGTG